MILLLMANYFNPKNYFMLSFQNKKQFSSFANNLNKWVDQAIQEDLAEKKIKITQKIKDGLKWVHVFENGQLIAGTNFSLNSTQFEIDQWVDGILLSYKNQSNETA